jgi:Zn-finger nucleic acid-binding protein
MVIDAEMRDSLLCGVCNVKLVEAKTDFSYMKHTFTAEVPRCPLCGQVYLSAELVKGRIAQVETELEDK